MERRLAADEAGNFDIEQEQNQVDPEGCSALSSLPQNRRIIIMGAGREGRIAADDCKTLGLEIAGFLDDTKPCGERINDIPVLGGFDLANDAPMVAEFGWIVALGNNEIRRELLSNIEERGGAVTTVIHPTCLISSSATIGRGVRIAAYGCVLPNSSIADYALLERYASIGADVTIREAAFIGPGCQIAGGCDIGRCASIGIGASMIERTKVGDHSIVGAGAAVTTDIPSHVLAVGVPARVKRSLAP